MPNRPAHPCGAPSCPALVENGRYCEKHQATNPPDSQRWRNVDRDRGSPTERGYGPYYRKWRAWSLRRFPICEASEGCSQPATDCHHLHEVSDAAWYTTHPGAMTDRENVQF